MTIRNKRDPKEYANENVVHTIKIIEALEGVNFEPVSIHRIMERTGLKRDKCMRVLTTLKMLDWATENEKKEWSLGTKILRFSNRYSELCIVALTK